MSASSIKNDLTNHDIAFIENAALKDFTTFKTGGNCPLLIMVDSVEKAEFAARCLARLQIKFIVIGEGSNILAPDQGVSYPVIRYYTSSAQITCSETSLIVSAGTCLDDVVAFAAEKGLKGINFASGIPGTIGGAVVGNAGAFGLQIGDIVETVTVLTEGGERVVLKVSELGFSYRSSIFKENRRWVLLTVELKMQAGNSKELMSERVEMLLQRREKHPDYRTTPCAGSFFKNIVHDDERREAAGWFLEQAGCKTLFCGDAAVFHGHANIIINTGQAATDDIIKLAQAMQSRVKEKFGLDLKSEVSCLGNHL